MEGKDDLNSRVDKKPGCDGQLTPAWASQE